MLTKMKWTLAIAGIPTVLAYAGCTLDKAEPPPLSGPSELAVSLEMRAIPDQLTADGFSSSVIEVVYRNENGQRTAGRTVLFDLAARGTVGARGGVFFDVGNVAPLNSPRPIAGGTEAHAVSAVTDSSGVARIRYWAPFRTDQENDIVVTITSRPEGTDFRAAVFRQVDIFLRAADRSFFAGGGVCGFAVEPQKPTYLVGEALFFEATQTTGAGGQPIGRYEWDFGDGTPARVGRRTEHAYSAAGTYSVTLFTTESVTGLQDACAAPFVIVSP